MAAARGVADGACIEPDETPTRPEFGPGSPRGVAEGHAPGGSLDPAVPDAPRREETRR